MFPHSVLAVVFNPHTFSALRHARLAPRLVITTRARTEGGGGGNTTRKGPCGASLPCSSDRQAAFQLPPDMDQRTAAALLLGSQVAGSCVTAVAGKANGFLLAWGPVAGNGIISVRLPRSHTPRFPGVPLNEGDWYG